jgi:short-subunit dehydrogenase
MIRTNVIGAMATVDAAVEHFLARGSGQVVGISSLASLQPIKEQAAYCASKAGFSMYLKAARRDLQGKGVVITDILPGYVKTDIVEGVDIGEIPFAVSPEEAARQIVSLIEKRVERGIVPWFPWALLRPLFGHIPQRWLP